mmetsp:Transcript_38599/g.46700  ORF Transcript_38599/g.46700 Transcript_38599/m.46700 type:complete len:187 (+) Transcript_38599:146-706(+)|eukprot:CAMPEP_0197847648 /NCGR_PEP_ID=MMETSP1438-20131217/6680_1 /TAXON_ID=1461541 /ORGANISM="Pterosperma sp., Strain CCMP1384" /LENGTH=186 /DNA_ID=CAMNT_0043459623 /DNA_START=139 /DNA_END=699 /DNA_ORIENTATION=-
MDGEEVIPPQYKVQKDPLDYRAVTTLKNRKTDPDRKNKKRRRDEDSEEEDMEEDVAVTHVESDPVETRARKRQAYQTNNGKVSGRSWKVPSQRHSSLAVKTDSQKKAWDLKMRERDQKKAVNERIKEAKREALAKVRAEKKRREEVKKQKEDNRQKSAITQKITNTKKVKNMSKKQAKNVRWVAGE